MKKYIAVSMLSLVYLVTLVGCRSRNSVNNTTVPTTLPTTVTTQPTTVATVPTTQPVTQPQTESTTAETGEETSTAPVEENEETAAPRGRSAHHR